MNNNQIKIFFKFIYLVVFQNRNRKIKKYDFYESEPEITNKLLFVEHVFKLNNLYEKMDKKKYDVFFKNFDLLTQEDINFISKYKNIVIAEELFQLECLKKNHEIICIWHGTFLFKKIAALWFKNYVEPFTKIVIGYNDKKLYSKLFNIEEDKIFVKGNIKSENIIKKSKNHEFLNEITKNKKVYLFNLSFVEKPFFGVNKFYKFKNFENKLNDDEIIIYNFHPSIYFFNKKHEEYSSKKIFHINNIDNTTLIKYADVVITDYSSSVSEAMLLNKPIMFLMENFLTYDRGFIIDKKEFPSIIIESSNISEILNKIRQTNSPNRNVYYTKYRNNIVYKNSLTNIKSFLEELIND